MRILDQHPALELLLHEDGAVAGAAGAQRLSGAPWRVRAGGVILATGGCAFRFGLLGSRTNTGDGHLMAAEAGAELSGMRICHCINRRLFARRAPALPAAPAEIAAAHLPALRSAGNRLARPAAPWPSRRQSRRGRRRTLYRAKVKNAVRVVIFRRLFRLADLVEFLRGNGIQFGQTAGSETDAAPDAFAHFGSEVERRCPVTQLFRRSFVEVTTSWTPAALKQQKAA